MAKFTEELYEAARPVWERCLTHSFVEGLGDGSLDENKFRYFMLQDYLYLFDYAKVFAIGISKTQDRELMKRFSAEVYQILNGEMNIHKNYMARIGVTEEEVFSVIPSLANTSYTSYMLRCAEEGGPEEVVASILACSWSYAKIGMNLAKRPGAMDHPVYGEWIRGYSDPGYQTNNDGLILLMDQMAEGLSPERKKHLTEVFVNCSRYELGFWDMAWEMSR